MNALLYESALQRGNGQSGDETGTSMAQRKKNEVKRKVRPTKVNAKPSVSRIDSSDVPSQTPTSAQNMVELVNVGKRMAELACVVAKQHVTSENLELNPRQHKPTKDELGMLRRMTNFIAQVALYSHARPELWVRLENGYEAAFGMNSEPARRVRAHDVVRRSIQSWWDPAFSRDKVIEYLRQGLIAVDSCFANITAEHAQRVLDRSSNSNTRGRGHVTALGTIVALSIAVGAFGDTDKDKAYKAFQNALRRKT
jgi:hypothetical protein